MIKINWLIVIAIILTPVGLGMAYIGTLGSSDLEVFLVLIGSCVFLLGLLAMSIVILIPIRRFLRGIVGILDRGARRK